MSILACNMVPLCSLWGLLLGLHIFLKSFDFLGYVGHFIVLSEIHPHNISQGEASQELQHDEILKTLEVSKLTQWYKSMQAGQS